MYTIIVLYYIMNAAIIDYYGSYYSLEQCNKAFDSILPALLEKYNETYDVIQCVDVNKV